MVNHLQVITVAGSKEEASKIAETVVQKRLAACAQILGPVSSVYRWEGKVERAEEWLCIMKTRAKLYPELESLISQVHSYDVPEILAVPIVEGSKSYLSWLNTEVKRQIRGHTDSNSKDAY